MCHCLRGGSSLEQMSSFGVSRVFDFLPRPLELVTSRVEILDSLTRFDVNMCAFTSSFVTVNSAKGWEAWERSTYAAFPGLILLWYVLCVGKTPVHRRGCRHRQQTLVREDLIGFKAQRR